MSFNMTLYRNANQSNRLNGAYPNGDEPASGAPSITATAISQDQIDIGWSAQAGSGIQIQRSTSVSGPWSTVAVYPETETSISLYSHEPGTQYYFQARYVSPASNSAYSSVQSATTTAAVSTIHVMTTGNDTTGDGSLGNPYASIQRGVWDATAGDVVNVHAGTYNEVAEWTPALGGGTPTFSGNRPAGVVFINSGTPTAPIIVQANPGDTVTMDQSGTHMGFAFWDATSAWPDYIHIKGFNITNCLFSAIMSLDNPGGDYTDGDALVARGVVIEDNTVTSTNWTTAGDNSSALRIDSHRDWTIRNNSIDGATLTGGGQDANSNGTIYGYNTFDALVEYNTFNNGYSGVYWKDTANNNPAYPTVHSTIRYNRFTDYTFGIYLNAGSGGTETDSYHVVHSNIFEDTQRAYGATGNKQAARIEFHNNFTDYRARSAFNLDTGSSSEAVGDKVYDVEGNIFSDHNGGSNITINDSGGKTDVINSDYNLFVSTPNIYLQGVGTITSLTTWQNISDSRVSDPNPDANSLANQTLSTLATNAATGDYTLPASSPAEAFLSDGSNAGPYRYGVELIGRIV